MSKRPKSVDTMSKAAKALIEVKFTGKTTLKQVTQRFYRIMRKYGIKKGTREGNGILCDNPEWTMCRSLYKDTIDSYLDWELALIMEPPKDLECY